jgi:hypothetical protein
LSKVGLVLDKPSSGLIFYQLCGPGRNQRLKFQAVRSGREPTGREDEKIQTNQESQELMAQKKKIVIEDENDQTHKDAPFNTVESGDAYR